jgi:hypothetical protein
MLKVETGKLVPVCAMKAYRGIRGIAPVVLILGTSWKRLVDFTPQVNLSLFTL